MSLEAVSTESAMPWKSQSRIQSAEFRARLLSHSGLLGMSLTEIGLAYS